MSNQKRKQAARETALQQLAREYEDEINARADYHLLVEELEAVNKKRDEALAAADQETKRLEEEVGLLVADLRHNKSFSVKKVQAITGYSTREQKRLIALIEDEGTTDTDDHTEALSADTSGESEA